MTVAELAQRWGVLATSLHRALRSPRQGRPAPTPVDPGPPRRYDLAQAEAWWGPPSDAIPHGTPTGYRGSKTRPACRCARCRAAHNDATKAERHERLYGNSGPMSSRVRSQIIAHIAAGHPIAEAARRVGITHQAVYHAMQALPEFAADVAAAEG